MIKINVIVKDKNWFKYIKNPEAYLSRKIKKIQTHIIYVYQQSNYKIGIY